MSESGGTPTYPSSDLDLDLRWWAAANYLTVGQIYLRDNALLREPLVARPRQAEAARALGHQPRAVDALRPAQPASSASTDADWLYVTGPGHGGPALVAAAWLEGTYTEVYPHVADDADGIRTLFRQFSSPGGVPSHVSVQTPGQHPRGRRARLRAGARGGAAFDHPDLVVACVVGDGEAETGPLAASWRLPDFLNPRRDGAVLPILHLNGYKIAGPTVLGRTSDEDVEAYLRSQGWDPVTVAGDDPRQVFPALLAALRVRPRPDPVDPGARRAAATGPSAPVRHQWPAIVLRTPKGWTGPAVVDGIQVEGTNLSHQVPLSGLAENPEHLRHARGVAAVLRPGVAVRRRRPARPRAAGAGARGRPADVRHARTPTAGGCARSCRCPTSTATRSRSTRPASPWSRTP